MAIADDLKEAFAQIRVRREDRDALRFHWLKDLASKQESKAEEVKQTGELFALPVEKTGNNDAFDELLEKHEPWRVLRVGGWIGRFLHNIRTTQKQRVVGPLTTEEIKNKTTFWIK